MGGRGSNDGSRANRLNEQTAMAWRTPTLREERPRASRHEVGARQHRAWSRAPRGHRSVRLGLDTSVVLRLLVGEPRAQAERAWQLVVETRSAGGDVAVSDLVVSEVYFALQYHYGVPKIEALEQLAAFLASGEIVSLGRAASVLAAPGLTSAKPGFIDRLIHAGYLRELDSMSTFAKAGSRVSRTRVVTTQ